MRRQSTQPDYDQWPRKKVRITELLLDPENIRLQIEVKSSQAALINDLFSNENAMQILESVVSNGFFPDEVPVAIKEGKKYTVIDGNRRIASLKVLARPEILPSKEMAVKKLLKQAERFPKSIGVIVAPSRESVRHFLASKHTQNTKRPWRPLRQAYFYKAELERCRTVKKLREEYPGVDIGKFLKLINIHNIAKSISYDTEQIAKKVHNERSFPASTIERLYEDKNIRKFLGIEFNKDGDVKIRIPKREFKKGFKRIVQDLVDKVVDSRKLNSETNRNEYLSNLPKDCIPKQTKGSKVTSSKDFKEKAIVVTSRRIKLVPKDIKFSLQAPGVRRMLTELQGLDFHRFPNAAHDLLRSFLECALKKYFSQKGVDVAPRKSNKFVFLDDVLAKFKEEMDSQKNRELAQVTQRIISSNTMTSYSAQFLNATNHNPSVFAVDKDVESAWDSMEGLFRYILDPK